MCQVKFLNSTHLDSCNSYFLRSQHTWQDRKTLTAAEEEPSLPKHAQTHFHILVKNSIRPCQMLYDTYGSLSVQETMHTQKCAL